MIMQQASTRYVAREDKRCVHVCNDAPPSGLHCLAAVRSSKRRPVRIPLSKKRIWDFVSTLNLSLLNLQLGDATNPAERVADDESQHPTIEADDELDDLNER